MPVRNINGVALNHYERGTSNKPTIVLVHPLLFDSTVFDPVVSELENDFHIVLIDIHGHGESGYRTPLTLEDMMADCHQLLLELNLSKVTWVGYSLGGMIGMRLAIQHPGVVESLILLATMARLDSPQIREQTWWLWQMFRAGHRKDIVNAALRFFFAPSTFSSQPQLIANYRDKFLNYTHSQAQGMFEVAQAVLNRTDISNQLSAIRTPTLVITGKEDLAPTPSEMESIASDIPKARFAVIDEASHLLAVEKPKEVAAILDKFLNIHKFGRHDLDGKEPRDRGQRRDMINSIDGVKPLVTLNGDLLTKALPVQSDMSVCRTSTGT